MRKVVSVKGDGSWLVNPGTVAGLAGPQTWMLGDLSIMHFEVQTLRQSVQAAVIDS